MNKASPGPRHLDSPRPDPYRQFSSGNSYKPAGTEVLISAIAHNTSDPITIPGGAEYHNRMYGVTGEHSDTNASRMKKHETAQHSTAQQHSWLGRKRIMESHMAFPSAVHK